MNKNIRIAKQLVKLAKELVSSKSRVAIGMPVGWTTLALKPELIDNWKKANTFDEFVDICKDVDSSSACCLIPKNGVNPDAAEHYFNMYGAPYYVFCENGNKPVVILHEKSHQLKNISDDNVPTDETILRSAAGFLTLQAIRAGKGNWSDVESECTGDFDVLKKYLEEAKEEWDNGDNMFPSYK